MSPTKYFRERRLPTDAVTAESGQAPPKRPRKGKAKLYVPALRSGAYAIILSLSTLPEETREGLSKQDLIALAQPHADTSFTVPSDPSKFYTAWASMKTLETKELVYKFGRPTLRYALTDEGWEVAKRIRETAGIKNTGIIEPEMIVPSSRQGLHNATEARSEITSTSAQQQRRNGTGTSVPHAVVHEPEFIEVDDCSPKQTSRERQSIEIGSDAYGGAHDRRVFMQELENRIFEKGDAQLDDLGLAKALVAARDLITSQTQKQRVHKAFQNGTTKTPLKRSISERMPSVSSTTRATDLALQGARTATLSSRSLSSNSAFNSSENRASSSNSLAVGIEVPVSLPSNTNSQMTEFASSHPSRTMTDPTEVKHVDIPPGSFTVELIVDAREVRTKVDREYIPSSLAKLGIYCTSRAMELGDMLWVARIHEPSIKRKFDLEDQDSPEIVLDYIVERKRLDDLDTSIKDHRFNEQKFRLKRSGVRNQIYLVEDYGSIGSMPEDQHQRLMTSITVTQVLDGLFVKRTRKLDDTIAYLARMTKLLKKQYENKPLTVIPSSILSSQNHLALRTPTQNLQSAIHATHYITYASFSSLMQKSTALTLRDVFLKMLMCTNGITGEKAIEIQRHWETPQAFSQALQHAAIDKGPTKPSANQNKDEVSKRDLVWSVAGHLVGRRKIGEAVSTRIGEIWGIDMQELLT